MTDLAEDRKPSEVTDDYWVWAGGPPGEPIELDATGKWLVFVRADELDDWWETIAVATRRGELGCQAKAATARENPNAHSNAKLICVYTRDWRDKDDVCRVLTRLRELGVI